MADDRAQLQPEPTVRGQERLMGDRRSYRAITPDAVGQDGEHRTTRRARETPDGEPTQTHTDRMRMPRQAPASLPGCLVFQLQAKGQEKGEDAFAKRLAKQLHGGGFILEINGDGAVFSRRFGRCAHGSPPGHQVSQAEETRWGERVAIVRPS
jgi:hypothetical protein